jgi:hypothetical protein
MLLFYTTPDFDKNLPWYGPVYRKWLLGVKVIKLPTALFPDKQPARVIDHHCMNLIIGDAALL